VGGCGEEIAGEKTGCAHKVFDVYWNSAKGGFGNHREPLEQFN
jgi:hypothetical protein